MLGLTLWLNFDPTDHIVYRIVYVQMLAKEIAGKFIINLSKNEENFF